MAYRYRAHIYWKDNSPGFAQWASDQVAQRLTMAFHLNEGAMNEERSENIIVNDFEWECNVFVPDESQAILEDFFAHMLSQEVRMETKVIEPETEEGETEYLPSWMDLHHCFNGENQPCEQPYMSFATDIPEPQEPPVDPPDEPDLCETTADWNISNATQYQTDFGAGLDVYVKHNNAIWKAKSGSHLWIAPAHDGNGAYSWEWVKDCN